MFNPRTEYDVQTKRIPIKDFYDYSDEYVVRPPYQRKNVWTRKKQQALLDSLFRRYYIPRIVMRQVRVNEDRTINEIIDGQQRINTAQQFFSGELALPDSLKDVHKALPKAHYADLPGEMRRFVDKELAYDADVVKNVDDPRNPEHLRVATEVFWRLQQGESLNYMEVAHSRLSSLARNFVVKYADDIGFDLKAYVPIDGNPDKHPFFSLLDRNNDRMQHLALLTRFLMFEEANGPTDIRESDVLEYITRYETEDGIGNMSFEEEAVAKGVLRNLSRFHDVFKGDPMLEGNGGIKELHIEYFILSMYLLLRHLNRYYVLDSDAQAVFHEFLVAFHRRWQEKAPDDRDILEFSDSRQQTSRDIETRHQIVRQLFFEYVSREGHQLSAKDPRRAFSEQERIAIYRRARGLCNECLAEGKSQDEARVPWADYDADHVVPHSKGGDTAIENAQLLCRPHNLRKGNRV